MLYSYTSAETRDAVEGICVHNVERRHPGSAIDIQSMKREGPSSFSLTGTATTGEGEAAEFGCFVYSDMHGGWGMADRSGR